MSELLSRKEAADLAGVTEKTIWQWCKESKFEFSKPSSNRLQINKESFERFLGNNSDIEKKKAKLIEDLETLILGASFVERDYYSALSGLLLYRFAIEQHFYNGLSVLTFNIKDTANLLKMDIAQFSPKSMVSGNPCFFLLNKMIQVALNMIKE